MCVLYLLNWTAAPINEASVMRAFGGLEALGSTALSIQQV